MNKEFLTLITAAIIATGSGAAGADMPAQPEMADFYLVEETSVLAGYSLPEKTISQKQISKKPKVRSVVLSGYSSAPEETDSTPFITASGNFVRDGVVAANFLALGTRIKIPEVFGNRVFVVQDRMAPRFSNNVDIWFNAKEEALTFGRKTAKIEIL